MPLICCTNVFYKGDYPVTLLPLSRRLAPSLGLGTTWVKQLRSGSCHHPTAATKCNEQPSRATANTVGGKACSSTKGGLLRYIPNAYYNHKVSRRLAPSLGLGTTWVKQLRSGSCHHPTAATKCNEQPSRATANTVGGKACSSTKGGLLRYIPNAYYNHKVSRRLAPSLGLGTTWVKQLRSGSCHHPTAATKCNEQPSRATVNHPWWMSMLFHRRGLLWLGSAVRYIRKKKNCTIS